MRIVSEDESGDAWRRLRREHSQWAAEMLVPRPGHPIYGVAAPSLTPAIVTEHSSFNGEWTSITVAYGPGDAPNGPYVAVTTQATDASMTTQARSPRIIREHSPEGDLRNALDLEQLRPTAGADASATEARQSDPPPPPVMSREAVATGTGTTETALVCRSADIWAAQWKPSDPALSVAVTIVGRGVALEEIRLHTVTDLRPMFEARAEIAKARIERGRRAPRPPLAELEPAEGVAAFRALAEFTLAENARRRAAWREGRDGREPRPSPQPAADWAGRYSALWQRAVREQQRLRDTNTAAANDAVTEAVNHLGFLGENAPWFSADPQLREAAIDQTLRRAMLGDVVPSEPAQEAWARHWSARMTRPPLDRESRYLLAEMADREALTAACLRAWAEWAETA